MENISSLGFSQDFLTITQRVQTTEEKNQDIGLHQCSDICSLKDNVKMKIWATDW